jgi:hypothetical protein
MEQHVPVEIHALPTEPDGNGQSWVVLTFSTPFVNYSIQVTIDAANAMANGVPDMLRDAVAKARELSHVPSIIVPPNGLDVSRKETH